MARHSLRERWLAPEVPDTASKSPRKTKRRLPRFRARSLPDQTQRRTVSADRPVSSAAALMSSSSRAISANVNILLHQSARCRSKMQGGHLTHGTRRHRPATNSGRDRPFETNRQEGLSPLTDSRWRSVGIVMRKARQRSTQAAPLPLVFALVAVYSLLILLATLTLSHKGSPPSPAFAPTPSLDPNLNFAGGDFVVTNGWNGCKIHTKLAATSKADGTGASGTVVMSAASGQSWCQGQASGRIICLLVSGNSAIYSGWLDDTTGIFSIGNVLQGSVTENAPQAYGPPVDRAFLGLADGSPECPPALSGPGGPQIISGTLHVSAARPPA